MIKVEKVVIEEFRGVRNLTLDFNNESFAVSGPNGTGKSGIVDAIEFALTGNISRLSGQGRGDLSVLKHGPHVDSQDNPEKAKVTLEVFIPTLGKKVQISRSVKNSKKPTVTPDDPEVKEVFEKMSKHPEFVLSRREIIKYVLAEPGKRADEVQALLQLEELEDIRGTLLKISNASAKELKLFEGEEKTAGEALMRIMEIDELTPEVVLEAANTKRVILGLPELTILKGMSLKDGLGTTPPPVTTRIPKAQALIEVQKAVGLLSSLDQESYLTKVHGANAALEVLKEDEANLKALEKESLLRVALELFDEHNCPVCGTEWEPEHFREVVGQQIARLKSATKLKEAAEALLSPIIGTLEEVLSILRSVHPYGSLLVPSQNVSEIRATGITLKTRIETLRQFLPIQNSIDALKSMDLKKTLDELQALHVVIKALPEASERDIARDYLVGADERLSTYRAASAKMTGAKKRSATAKQTYDVFTISTDAALEKIYKEVESEFKEFYRFINDDESEFEAKLTPSIGKLGFGVDFYGRGSYPPGAFHSEGHQDAMGLCLYLALMKHILKDNFKLAVLDDVLMSVDSGHRREVCKLLKTKFPDTQFILTTHDPVWLRHMKSAGLIKAKAGIEFQNWTVDKGPSQWKDIDVWSEIEEYLAKNDVRAAAALLRHFMEYTMAEHCADLKGRVEYRGDNRYDLGNFLPAAANALKSHLKEAKKSAESWGSTESLAQITQLEDSFKISVANVLNDEWQYINPAVHYNEWETYTAPDFKPVVLAFKELSDFFVCKDCGGSLFISGVGFSKDSLRCPCQKINHNLKLKES